MSIFCVDFDDLCDAVAGEFGKLVKLKEKYPKFKVTLFTIPKRISDKTIAEVKLANFQCGWDEWVQLAPHGWRHTRGECLSWTAEESADKIKAAHKMGIDAPVFRAPAWLIDGDVYTACDELNVVVASHAKFRVPNTGVKEYIYNNKYNEFHSVHGHLTPVSGNYIGDMLDDTRLRFPENAEFAFPQDLAMVQLGEVLCAF